MSDGKSLVYVVNRVSADDTQHFVHIPNLLNRLRDFGWAVELVSERGGEGRAEVAGIPVRFLSREGRWSRLPALVRALVAARRKGNRLVFVRISKSAALVSALAGRLLGWKTLFWLSGTIEDYNIRERGWRGRLEVMQLWLLMRLVDHLVTGPETMGRYYEAYYGLRPGKVRVLYNDIETKGVTPSRGQGGEAGEPIRVLMVHRLSPVRETMNWFPGLVAMLAERRRKGEQVVLDVVGDGAERAEMEHAAAQVPDAPVTFHGAVANRLLDPIYARADLFIMPSQREGFPRVVIEAMARGLPVVVTEAGGTRDLLGPQQQPYCIAVEDRAGFVRAVAALLDSAEERRALAEENLVSVQRFSTSAVAAQYDARLVEILAA